MRLATPGDNCPYLAESDVLSLSGDFVVRPTMLEDTPLGVQHTLHGEAAAILTHLQQGVTYRSLIMHSRALAIPETALTELLGFLNIIGALKREPSTVHMFKRACLYVQDYMYTRRHYQPFTWRQGFCARSLLIATLQASIWVIAGAAGVSLLFILGIGFSPAIVWPTVSSSLILLIVSTFLHEYAHYVFIVRDQVPVAIVRRGMRLGLIHQTATLSVKAELSSAAAGPIVGSAVSLLAASLAYHNGLLWLTASSLCIAAIHIGSLLPWYGDGKSLLEAWHKRRPHETI